MTRAVTELLLGLHLLLGIELAEWSLRQTERRADIDRIGQAKSYLLIVAIGPLYILWIGPILAITAFTQGVLWRRHVTRSDVIRIWSLVMAAVVLLILNITML